MNYEPGRIKKLIPIGEVCSQTSLGKSCIYAMIKVGEFPKPRKITAGRVGWVQDEITAYIESRPTADLDVRERGLSAA
ncbi:MAG: AlpA family phage regulatory protein [Hyphomicrobium sp.]|nr:AlpA family phage regulatory protein [Hyphomicrobium sp.]